jgi:histidinol dehydrogenase
MRIVEWSSLASAERQAVLARPALRADAALRARVETIFADIARDGASAVARLAVEIDKFPPRRIDLDAATIARARAQIDPNDLAALALAAENISAYHEATRPRDVSVAVRAGVICERRWRAIDTAGLYAPGGSAPLFSTLLMLALPARAAGVANIVVCTPPNRDGEAEPVMIAAAALCGLEALWLIGGAQAIAAMTYGAGMAKADKLFGPGNAYVAEAKRIAAALPGGPQIDTPAGPSELMVIADAHARADFVAADLLSQAEHDADAQVLLVTSSREFADAALAQVKTQLATLPRKAIAARSLAHARCIVVEDIADAVVIANRYAPEHLALQLAAAEDISREIVNAGAVFVGAWSAETFGDYVCGPSHVLPTDGAARNWSGVSVDSFMKCVNVQTLTREGAAGLRDAAARLARLEGLEAHARAADIRGA